MHKKQVWKTTYQSVNNEKEKKFQRKYKQIHDSYVE